VCRGHAYLERNLVCGRLALLHAAQGALDELLRVSLQVEHLVGRNRVEHALQPRGVRPVQEELLPEAIGQVCLLLVLLRCALAVVVWCWYARTLNKVSYSRMILGWKISGRESCVSGEGSIVRVAVYPFLYN
jgi:hypothetical protein